MDELRRRLQEAEHSWMQCKEDCIRFTERLNNAEREVSVYQRFFSFSRFFFFSVRLPFILPLPGIICRVI